jgi:hypothetical protein
MPAQAPSQVVSDDEDASDGAVCAADALAVTLVREKYFKF